MGGPTRPLFVYGSLMFDPVWRRVVRGAYAARPARLDGYARHAVRGETYPAIVARDGASVDGIVWLDIDAEDLARLDRFEGGDYRRSTVPVALADRAKRLEADTYVWLDAARLAPEGWDPQWFEREGLASFLATHCGARELD